MPSSIMTISCPLCHHPAPIATETLSTDDGAWQCTTCGQHWDRVRLATVAAYERFMTERL